MATTTEIRDLTGDFRMPADRFAAIFEIEGEFLVAWGLGYEAIAEGRDWATSANTADHGALQFATLEDAEEYARDVEECFTWIPEDPT